MLNWLAKNPLRDFFELPYRNSTPFAFFVLLTHKNSQKVLRLGPTPTSPLRLRLTVG